MPAGLEPGYHRWSRRDERAIVFPRTPKGAQIKRCCSTTVNSKTAEVLDCISIDPKKGEDFQRTVIKDCAEVLIDTYSLTRSLPNGQRNANTSAKGKLAMGLYMLMIRGGG